MRPTQTCPHCGNTDSNFIGGNGLRPSAPDYTLLCTARVDPDDWSFDIFPEPDEIGADGKVACGMQWEPNNEESAPLNPFRPDPDREDFGADNC